MNIGFDKNYEKRKIVSVLVQTDQEIEDVLRNVYRQGVREGILRAARVIDGRTVAGPADQPIEFLLNEIEK